MKTLSLLLIFLFATNSIQSQNASLYEGDVLLQFIGTSATSQEMKDLKLNFNCQMANETHYLSKDGLELILKRNALNEIHLYSKSAVYGAFTGKLPKGLKFGMLTNEVRAKLGKPLVSYNSGYSEYETSNLILSCWFESGKLSQVGFALKDSE